IGFAFRFSVDVLAEAEATTHPLYPSALGTAAVYAALRRDLDATEQFCRQASAAAPRPGRPDPPDEHGAPFAPPVSGFSGGACSESVAHCERAADVGRSSGNRRWVATGLGGAALFAMMGGDSDTAARLATEGLAAARELGSPGWIAQNQLALA